MKLSPPFKTVLAAWAALAPTLFQAQAAPPASTAMHLGGKLTQAGAPASGEHEFRFQLFTTETGDTVAPKTQTIDASATIAEGNWQTALDIRRFGGERSILDDTVFPPGEAVGILDDTVIPLVGDRSILDNTVRTSLQQNWRTLEGNWLQISVRRKGSPTFVPLSPRQRLGAVPRASSAFSAEHAVVAGSVAEGGVDASALAPGAINNSALANLAITAPKIAPLTVVRSLNGLQDDVTLAAGAGVSLSAAGNTLTIHSTATGAGTPLPNGNFIGANNDNQFGEAASFSSISGGRINNIGDNSDYGVVGGGQDNSILGGSMSTIGGGWGNRASGGWTTIAGGAANLAQGEASTVAGGQGNQAKAQGATVGGGSGNVVDGAGFATIGGGRNNKLDDNSADGVIAGGFGNSVNNAPGAVISGGDANLIRAGAQWSVISGGQGNVADAAAATIIGGQDNVITGGVNGHSTILGGLGNKVESSFGLAAGYRASATHSGSFVWNSWNGEAAPFASLRDGEFAARAPGGFRLVTEGAELGEGDIRLDAGNAALLASGKSAQFNFSSAFNVSAAGGVNFTTGGQGLFVDGQRIGAGGGQTGTGPIVIRTGGGQTEPQLRVEQTNPDDYARIFVNTPRAFWSVGAGGPHGWFSFYAPGQSPANTADTGGDRLILTANGEVGVGSDRPFAQFHVRGRGAFDLPQIRATQLNAQDFARLRLETGAQAWDIAAGPDGSLRFFGGGADRMVLGSDGVQIATGAAGLRVNGRLVAYADQLSQGGQGGNGGPVSATAALGVAVAAVAEDPQGGVGVSATGRVGVQALSSNPQGAAVRGIQLNGSGYAGDFAGKVKVSSTLEANGGLRLAGSLKVAGAGDNTPTAAFRLLPDQLEVVSAAVPGSFPSLYAVIDHPMLNHRPDAMLMLTPVNASACKLLRRDSDVMRGDFLSFHPDTDSELAAFRGRWVLDITRAPAGVGQPNTVQLAVFNALVATP